MVLSDPPGLSIVGGAKVKVPQIGTYVPDRERREPFVPFYRAGDVHGVRCVLTGYRVLISATHWRDGRTVPCTGSTCWCVQEGKQPKRYGYVSCMTIPKLACGILELTAGACDQLAMLVPDLAQLRGIAIHARKRDRRKQAAVDVMRIQYVPPIQLPPEIDPLPYLLKRLGLRCDFAYLQQFGQPKLADHAEYASDGEEVAT